MRGAEAHAFNAVVHRRRQRRWSDSQTRHRFSEVNSDKGRPVLPLTTPRPERASVGSEPSRKG